MEHFAVSGTKCTPLGRRCITTAFCDEHRICRCPPDTVGNGLIECVPADYKVCTLSADPHLVSYNNARVDVDLPCSYRLARFVTNRNTSRTPQCYCSIEVYATNVMHNRNYFVRSVHINVGVTDVGQQVHNFFELHKYGVSEKQMYKFMGNMTKTRTPWGFGQQTTEGSVDIYPTFDEENNFAVLLVPMCDVRIKYRASDPNKSFQELLPGISIMAPPHSQFLKEYGSYPSSLCGDFSDTSSVYEDRARQLGLYSASLAVIYDVLEQRPPQMHNSVRTECEAAIDAFAASRNKTDDINICGPILAMTGNRRCVVDQGKKPIKVFAACLRYRVDGNSADCYLLLTVGRCCERHAWQALNITSC